MGHTSAGRDIKSLDLVGCIMSLDTVISRDCLAQVPRRPSIRVTQPSMSYSTNLSRPSPRLLHSSEWPGLSPGARGHLFRPEAFLGMPGASRLQFCAWTHVKKAFWWVARQILFVAHCYTGDVVLFLLKYITFILLSK